MKKILIRPGLPGERLPSAENSGTCYNQQPARGQTLCLGQDIVYGWDGFEYPLNREEINRYLMDTGSKIWKNQHVWSIYVLKET